MNKQKICAEDQISGAAFLFDRQKHMNSIPMGYTTSMTTISVQTIVKGGGHLKIHWGKAE